MLLFRALLHLPLKSPGKRSPSRFPNGGLYGESCPFPETSFTFLSNSSTKVLLIKKSYPFLEGPRKGASPQCSPERGPYGNRPPFPDSYLAYPSGSSVKEPSHQVSLIELSQRERERHSVFRALLRPSFKVPGK